MEKGKGGKFGCENCFIASNILDSVDGLGLSQNVSLVTRL